MEIVQRLSPRKVLLCRREVTNPNLWMASPRVIMKEIQPSPTSECKWFSQEDFCLIIGLLYSKTLSKLKSPKSCSCKKREIKIWRRLRNGTTLGNEESKLLTILSTKRRNRYLRKESFSKLSSLKFLKSIWKTILRRKGSINYTSQASYSQ